MGTWIRHHWILSILICFGATMFTLFLLNFRYPVIEEKVLKRVLSYFSVVLVAITYFTVFALTALGFKALGKKLLPDPSKLKGGTTYWTKREKTAPTLDYLRRQF